ncbi:hypothetical protein PT276_00455 [Orbaceae bacterium ESL0721]|nr:hypothetical protein [Orbaceae bacterium ESL0721]
MLTIIYGFIVLILIAVSLYKGGYLLCTLSCLLTTVYLCAILPIPGKDRKVRTSPTQVVFRFDESRYLQLTGSGCRGKLYYIDEKSQVYNELAVHSAEVLTEPFAHTAGDYIFVPYETYSGVLYSQDGGRIFKTVHTSPGLWREKVKGTVVVNNQLFTETVIDNNPHFNPHFKDTVEGMYRSAKPYGSHIATDILSYEELDKRMKFERFGGKRWQSDITELPQLPSDYKGWYKWQCDPDKEQYAIVYNRFTPLITLQSQLHHWLKLDNGDK